jgi:hypothetical protein
MKDLISALANSKKFMAAIIGLIVGIAGKFGFNLDPATVGILVAPFVAYIAGQGIADNGKHAAEITALAQISPSEARAVIRKKAETKG